MVCVRVWGSEKRLLKIGLRDSRDVKTYLGASTRCLVLSRHFDRVLWWLLRVKILGNNVSLGHKSSSMF